MSALPQKADIAERDEHVRFVPEADITPHGLSSLPQYWPRDREHRAAIIGNWLQAEAQFPA